jgi:HlyD family secretion protein
VSELYVQAGEWVGPGQAILELADLGHLRIETTDLNEIDAARVKEGDRVTVTFDALPDVQIAGTVERIAPKSAKGSGVNYTVIVELSEWPEILRWGMTAFVDILVEED